MGLGALWAAALAGPALAQPVPEGSGRASISGNPAATTFSTGTGQLGRWLGLRDEWGVRLGGLWLADTNFVVAGGVQPGGWSNNSALFVGLGLDAEKLVDWRGASFGFQFLQFNGADNNSQVGMIVGYNGIVGPFPHNRSELFQAWYEQTLFEDVLKVRIGRSTPSADFNNVLRPVAFTDSTQNVPSLSGVLYPTIFCNGSMIGVLPGYYNPGDGVTVNFTPTTSFYLNLGAYDGNNARGVQTGITAPQFNGYYFTIAEIGFDWLLGEGRHPGQFGIGLWRQTGQLTARGINEQGTGGVYAFGSQRVAFGLNDRVAASSVSVFYQFGVNSSQTMPINQYYGAGITGFALIGDRERDSMGLGVALSRPNPNLFTKSTEVILQAYYQAHVAAAIFLQPTVSYIPSPGAVASAPGALTTTLRLTVLF
ncbi:MAG TPA: carbohydrate porin [Reyranella sp.]|nr:carbohydrate porin [Reyranella sp.]